MSGFQRRQVETRRVSVKSETQCSLRAERAPGPPGRASGSDAETMSMSSGWKREGRLGEC